MRLSGKQLFTSAFLIMAVSSLLFAQESIPRFTTVDPMNGKAGTEVTITGENIGKALVAEVYFTDGKNDLKTAILDQTDTTIKVKAPEGVKAGVRYRLMLLTKGKEPKLIEQPVRFEIDE